jgi:hypothetical protein
VLGEQRDQLAEKYELLIDHYRAEYAAPRPRSTGYGYGLRHGGAGGHCPPTPRTSGAGYRCGYQCGTGRWCTLGSQPLLGAGFRGTGLRGK